MNIILNNASMVPIYEQLMEQIKAKIISGELKENEPLPSVRVLATELKISSLTVKKAYDHLEEAGFVITIHGKGTYIAETDRDIAMEARKKAIEDELCKALDKARAIGLSEEEVRQMIDILMEDWQ